MPGAGVATVASEILFGGITGEMYAYEILSLTLLDTGANTITYPKTIKTPIAAWVALDPGVIVVSITSIGSSSMVVNTGSGAGSGAATVVLLVPASG